MGDKLAGSKLMTTTILKTKLFVPKPRSGLVRRTRLVDKMDEGLDRVLVLVSAPAGFGKSTMLSEWVDAGDANVIWLSLDQSDNDIRRFFSYLISAVQQINKSINEVMSRTFVTSLTTAMVLLALFFFGGSVIHDFSLALLLGVMVGTYSSIFIASPVLSMWPEKKN